jgi:tRNA G46 methylase TrmB
MENSFPEVIELLSIGPKVLFLDLGSGFGHLLAAARLNHECAAIGIEIVENLIQPAYFLIH